MQFNFGVLFGKPVMKTMVDAPPDTSLNITDISGRNLNRSCVLRDNFLFPLEQTERAFRKKQYY